MSFWSRIGNVLRGERVSREIDEEFQAHIDEALARGRDPGEARQAFGSVLRQREREPRSAGRRLARIAPCRCGLRLAPAYETESHLRGSRPVAGSGNGRMIAAFRLIDAVLLRRLPVEHAERLYAVSRQEFRLAADGKAHIYDGWAYPAFRLMRAGVKDQADLIAATGPNPAELTYGSAQETEKARVQYVSGGMFASFGLRPALGRLLVENDDREPGAHPYAVLSADYWMRRFAGDPQSHRAHLPDGQAPLPDRRRLRGAVHRHRDRLRDRHVRAHHDESGG